jgi:hypothetical protein
MIRFAKIKRMIKSFLTEITSIGGVTQNRFISPKGLFSKPKDENAIVINLSNGANQDVVLALQKDVDLQDGDVYLTDDKNFIHFKFKQGIIEIQGDAVFDDNVTIKKDLTVNGKIVCDTTIEAGISVTAPNVIGSTDVAGGGISLKSHTHTGDSGGTTSPPN